jgi:hypothetical protein
MNQYAEWPMSSGTELAAVVFGQHVHTILFLVIFPGVVWRTKFTTLTPPNARTKRKYEQGNCKYSCRTTSKGK